MNAIVATGSSFSDQQNTTLATRESTDPVPPLSCTSGISGGNFRTIWYQFTPSSNVTITADTVGSAYDTILSIWTGSPSSFVGVACDDDGAGTPGGPSRISGLALTAGTTYRFMIGGFSNTQFGPTTFNLTVGVGSPGFSLSANPTTRTVTRVQSGTYTITVTPQGGSFTNVVTFACSGLPNLSSCTFMPASVTPNGAPATTQLSIHTTAPGAMVAQFGGWQSPPVWALTLMLGAVLLFRLGLALRRPALRVTCHIACVVVLVGLVQACGGGGGVPPKPGTNPGTYAVKVTGAGGTTTSSVTVTLVVVQ